MANAYGELATNVAVGVDSQHPLHPSPSGSCHIDGCASVQEFTLRQSTMPHRSNS